jgi:hypothetical protein
MKAPTKVLQSRIQWKDKAIYRGDDNRYLRKESHRFKIERDAERKRADQAEERVRELEQQVNCLVIQNKVDLIWITLQLFLVARVGYRAVSRILTVLAGYLGITKAPCPQTVINWVIRLSIARIQAAPQLIAPRVNSDVFSNGFIWMMDISIGLNDRKILAFLGMEALHHQRNLGAPTLQNVHCIGVFVAPSWTGDSILEVMERLIGVMGRPIAILKDGGKDLARAVRLLNEQGTPCLSIDDISHVIANLLKHEYVDHPSFKTFLSACGQVSKKLKQSVLACLVPPKTSIKARFMNVHRLFKWADQFLAHSPVGRAAEGSMLEKLRASLGDLPDCKGLITRFVHDVTPLLECQKILKNHGLSHETKKDCESFFEQIPTESIRGGMINWLNKQFEVGKKIGLVTAGMPISSDPIESLFAIGKYHGVGEIKDANRIALRLPSLCGKLTREDAQKVMKITTAQQVEVTSTLPSITQQRRQVLPTPGTLETLSPKNTGKNLELIPESKNRGKNQNSNEISNHYLKSLEPDFEVLNSFIFPINTEPATISLHA